MRYRVKAKIDFSEDYLRMGTNASGVKNVSGSNYVEVELESDDKDRVMNGLLNQFRHMKQMGRTVMSIEGFDSDTKEWKLVEKLDSSEPGSPL